jgi:hypothetical protein
LIIEELFLKNSIFKNLLFTCTMIAAAFPASTGRAPTHAVDSAEGRALRERGLAEIDKGNPVEADGLLAVADSAGVLSAGDYLRWLEVKAVLSKYGDAARLCCKMASREPRFISTACGRLMQMVEDQPQAAKRDALAAYRGCALSSPGCDTPGIRQRLSRAYAAFALYAQQDSLLTLLDTKKFPSTQEFLDAATERFSQGFVSEAVYPAMKAYTRLTDTAARSLAATMLFQWYRQDRRSDSASLWLARASLSDERFKVIAIGFLQSAGMLDKADSLMTTLRPSLTRDTLMLRALLFAGNAKAAYARCGGIPFPRDEAVLWKTRTALFSGNGADLIGWIDTVTFAPASPLGEEVLSYRYRLEVLASAPQAMQDFCAMAFALWRGRPDKAAVPHFSAYPRPVREMLVCDIVKGLIGVRRFGEARDVAAAFGLDSAGVNSAGPELRYYHAKILIQQGLIDQGAAALEQLMLAYPHDVFSGRARLLLASLKKKR